MDVASLLLLSAPVFLIGMGVEMLVLRRYDRQPYDGRDSAVSITTALINQALNAPWAFIEIAVLVWMCSVMPWHLTGWAAWLTAMIAVDFVFYWYHRSHHEIRLLWAVHVVHHSSERYNLSVALRQPWAVFTTLPFLIPVALLGIDAKIILACFALNLLYQFFLHTELIDKLWAPIEFVFNTPSHHRVHHGSQQQYLDTNYGGILIIWDRLFGSFEPEGEQVRYGLTKNIKTYNIAAVEAHEFVAIWKAVRGAKTMRDRFGHLFRGPGWAPAALPLPSQLPAPARVS